MHEFRFENVLNEELWIEAQWKSVVFITDPYEVAPPCIGLVFAHEEVGKRIFRGWQTHTKTKEQKQMPGTSVHEKHIPMQRDCIISITSNTKAAPFRAEAARNATLLDSKASGERSFALPFDGGSAQYIYFLEAYEKHRKYFLVPVSMTNEDISSLQLQFEYAIEMTQLHFREETDEDTDMA